jgi:hypothetical protein
MLHVIRWTLHVGTWCTRSRSKHFRTHARTRAKCNVQTPLSVWPWRMRRSGAKSSRTPLVTAAVHTVHSSCTASVAAQRCRLAAREGAAGGRDGEEPRRLVHRAFAFVQGTPQRRRWALAALVAFGVRCIMSPALLAACPYLLAAAAAYPNVTARSCNGAASMSDLLHAASRLLSGLRCMLLGGRNARPCRTRTRTHARAYRI